VKALIISMSVLLLAFFSFTPAFGQPQDANKVQPIKPKEEPAKKLEYKKTADANRVADANAVIDANNVSEVNMAADVNVITDANAVRAEIGKFEGLGEALSEVNTASNDEISKWTSSTKEEKADIALAVQKQITTELKFLRETAVKEKDAKTTAAIDGILLDRQERFKNVIEKLEQETERYRKRVEREEKRKEQQQQERNSGRPINQRPIPPKKEIQQQ
jgi:predicted Fe-S protein YdhL (DUF1289 family)